jgi:hypothetical protein
MIWGEWIWSEWFWGEWIWGECTEAAAAAAVRIRFS